MATAEGLTTSEDYRYEVNRINSFFGWPLNETHKPERLASVGFVYTGEGTLVQCFHCGIKYRAWTKGDNPLSVHQKCNSRCPFLRTLACKQKPSKQYSSSVKPHNYNNYGQSSQHHGRIQSSHQATVGVMNNFPGINCDAGSCDNTAGVFMAENYQHKTERTKLLVGWSLNKVANPELLGRMQNEINMLVEAEENHFFTSTLPQDHQSTISQSALPLCRLPGHPDLMTFPDNSLPQQYCEQSESEDRGGIDPFKFDAISEGQTRAEQVAAERHVKDPTVLSMHRDEEKKPFFKLSLNHNVDFSDLWMVRLKKVNVNVVSYSSLYSTQWS